MQGEWDIRVIHVDTIYLDRSNEPVDRPGVIILADDEFYARTLENWDEVDSFIKEITDAATVAFGDRK